MVVQHEMNSSPINESPLISFQKYALCYSVDVLIYVFKILFWFIKWKSVGFNVVDFYCRDKNSRNIPKNILFCRVKKVIQVWNDMWMSKLWQNYNVWVDYSFKAWMKYEI